MRILGVRLDILPPLELRQMIEARLQQGEDGLLFITTVNAECLAIASSDDTYREVLNQASLNVIDGAGVALIARLRGQRRPHRAPGSELIYELARTCQITGNRLFLLGSETRTARRASERLHRLYPGLQVDWYSPSFSPSLALSVEDEAEIERRLREYSPGVLCVALGMPKQEFWIHQHKQPLAEWGVKLAIGIGGALAYVAGDFPEPPRWVRALGLEWLYRLLRQPHKRFRRQALRLPRFLALALLETAKLRLRSPRRAK
ncbi:MAG TPA: WecB/TagA/CpsF family glycosyltransferase [Dehalococcoidia bacterium]|nr:WecB/TagA/CpsF family glycosyltransferase [Dehalococcoidia bacterium]